MAKTIKSTNDYCFLYVQHDFAKINKCQHFPIIHLPLPSFFIHISENKYRKMKTENSITKTFNSPQSWSNFCVRNKNLCHTFKFYIQNSKQNMTLYVFSTHFWYDEQFLVDSTYRVRTQYMRLFWCIWFDGNRMLYFGLIDNNQSTSYVH